MADAPGFAGSSVSSQSALVTSGQFCAVARLTLAIENTTARTSVVSKLFRSIVLSFHEPSSAKPHFLARALERRMNATEIDFLGVPNVNSIHPIKGKSILFFLGPHGPETVLPVSLSSFQER